MDRPAQQSGDAHTDHIAPITIRLTPEQVAHVVAAVRAHDNRPLALREVGPELFDGSAEPPEFSDPNFSGSVLRGLLLLTAFPSDGESLRVRDLARWWGLNPSVTYRYLRTLRRVGLLDQDLQTREYCLGGRSE